jgi:glutamate synthase (NADPH/NADH) large chain
VDAKNAPIPSLLAVSSIHEHLTRKGLRARTGLLVEAADLRETHHFATVIGYGGNAVNPYLVFESIPTLRELGLIPETMSDEEAIKNYIHAIDEGLLKIFSKMGISTLRSYHGAQIFEILGISSKVVNKSFTGSVSRIEGLDYDDIAKEVLIRHQLAYTTNRSKLLTLQVGGVYSWRRKGEAHLMNPDSITLLQESVQNDDYETYKKFAGLINNQNENPVTIRSLFEFKKCKSIFIEEVEPEEKILKRFTTGAMSFGSISYEAHTTLAIAMNRIGGKSNSGEGGEDEVRFEPLPNGDSMRSAIKQVASGRFGVTSHYLTNADELQIKIGQGAKPGEGGQLPGHKVNEWIGRVRHSTPGVGLISPPPHHDIYSIEDLAQLIFDLRKANRAARVSVKLVSSAGVGTIAAGVAKAKADAILISGGDGGTGASPISSIRYTGLPWEIGLAEAHQTLVMNNLRSRVTLQTDGMLRTGRDIAIAALLGAEEWGIATAALIAEGCIMMRKCHLNTCPAGIATQDEELRKRFKGKPEHLINYFRFIVRELREIMAELGFRTVNEMIGQVDLLKMNENQTRWKLRNLDLSSVLYKVPAPKNVGLYKQISQPDQLTNSMEWKLIESAQPALIKGEKVYGDFAIKNINRTIGTMLSNEISKKYKKEGLPEDTIHYKFRGSAGQSFGAFSAPGLTLELEGETNDYLGKGLSGTKIILYPDRESKFDPHENIIAGNVAFYGATSGEAYISGLAGQRFCVRNSGAIIVVEGVGDHCCEYMTGGIVIILGKTGRNFAAGMSGGIAYVYDPDNAFNPLCNKADVFLETCDEEDKKTLFHFISRHVQYTMSAFATTMLNNIENEYAKFVKIMPKDYKAILEKKNVKQAELVTIKN